MDQGVDSKDRKAEHFKVQGNIYFREGRLNAAISAYTEAIALIPTITTYWTNRALCYRKQLEWRQVEADCRKALELDKRSVKAHYMLGLALLESKQYQDAVKHLEKALDLGRGGDPSVYMVEEIWREIAKAKYTEWEHTSHSRMRKHEELRAFCEKAMKEDFERKCEKINGYHDINLPINKEAMGDQNSSMSLNASELEEEYREQRLLLSEIFKVAAEQDTPSEIPEYLCCKISMDIFRDPVITPNGITYERAVIREHLEKVGKFDPLSRTPLETEQLVPNLAMKEAVQDFLSKHGWAYKMSQDN